MPHFAHLPLFVVASLVLLLTPGPAVLYIVARSVEQGRVAGLVSVLSIETGNLLHAILAAAGLSALLVSSALAFTLIKYLGAAYLVYLGLRKMFARPQPVALRPLPPQSLRQIFSQGVVVAALNPKTALFFLAFLPQFVDRTQGAVGLQMLLLGVLFVALAVITDSLYALLASSAGQWLKRRQPVLGLERYVVGAVYMGLGVTAALARQ